MAAQPQAPLLSFDEYITLEQKSDRRHEYHGGHLSEIEAATVVHEQICAQLIVALSRAFPECTVYTSNLNIYIESSNRGVYPDSSVICGPPAIKPTPGPNALVVLNPFLVAEVLSPSTEDYDRGKKSGYYRTIPSLQHILLIAQDRIAIEHFRRTGPGEWAVTLVESRSQTVDFSGCELALQDIYRHVEV